MYIKIAIEGGPFDLYIVICSLKTNAWFVDGCVNLWLIWMKKKTKLDSFGKLQICQFKHIYALLNHSGCMLR